MEVIEPTFEFISIPGALVYNLRELVTMNFQVKNTGQRTGMAKVKLEVLDIESDEKQIFISPTGTQNFDFSFSIPNDMEAKTYTAKVYLNGNVLEIPFTIRGIDLTVQANFDKQAYTIGETARLTLNITNNNAGTAPELFAKVNYDTTSIDQNFIMTGGEMTGRMPVLLPPII